MSSPSLATSGAHGAAKDHGTAVVCSVNDKDEFIYRETQWIGVALKERKPLLGICLGAQMLANHVREHEPQ